VRTGAISVHVLPRGFRPHMAAAQRSKLCWSKACRVAWLQRRPMLRSMLWHSLLPASPPARGRLERVYRISSLVFIKPPPRNQAAASVLPQAQTAHAPELLPPQGEPTWPSLKCIGQQGEQNRHPSCFIVVPTDSPATTCCYPLACGGCRASPKLSQGPVSHPPTHLPSNLTMLTIEDEEQAHH
jgi:hypothetical protein